MLAGAGAAFFVLPLIGLILRAPWANLWPDLTARRACWRYGSRW